MFNTCVSRINILYYTFCLYTALRKPVYAVVRANSAYLLSKSEPSSSSTKRSPAPVFLTSQGSAGKPPRLFEINFRPNTC